MYKNTILCCDLKTGAGFSLERYALGVYNEICMALEGLVEEE
jgi:hypothetical protein